MAERNDDHALDHALDHDVALVALDHRVQWRASDGVEFCAECNVEWPCAVWSVVGVARKYAAALAAIRDLPQTGVVEAKASLLAREALA